MKTWALENYRRSLVGKDDSVGMHRELLIAHKKVYLHLR